MIELLCANVDGLFTETIGERSVVEMQGVRVYVPIEGNWGLVVQRVAEWTDTFPRWDHFDHKTTFDIIITDNTDAVGTVGHQQNGSGESPSPILWQVGDRWQRNVWYLSHEAAEILLKRMASPPRWFVEGFAQVYAYYVLSQFEGGSPYQTAVDYYGYDYVTPEELAAWENPRALTLDEAKEYFTREHRTLQNRRRYATALWLFLNVGIDPVEALNFCRRHRAVAAPLWLESFLASYGGNGPASALVQPPPGAKQ